MYSGSFYKRLKALGVGAGGITPLRFINMGGLGPTSSVERGPVLLSRWLVPRQDSSKDVDAQATGLILLFIWRIFMLERPSTDVLIACVCMWRRGQGSAHM